MKPTKYLKLPFHFDKKALLKDLNHILKSQWISHFHNEDYSGGWNVIPLLSPQGDPKNTFSTGSHHLELEETPILKACTYFQEVIDSFKCLKQSARLLQLLPDSKIHPHKDNKCGYENSTFRIHIPIQTNPKVEFYMEKERLTLLPGECWYIDANFEHSVKNLGDTSRVHLVIDGERNSWSDNLFFALAPRESFFPNIPEFDSLETIKRIIAELKSIGAEKELIQEWTGKLNK